MSALPNNPPVVGDLAKSTNEDTSLPFTLADFSAKYSDADNDPMTRIRITSLPANGILKLSGTDVVANDEIPVASVGNLLFIPSANWNGITDFGWNGFDGTVYATANGSVSITVVDVNDPPVASNDAAITDEDTEITINVIANDTDIDGTINGATIDLDPATAGVQTTITVPGEGIYSVGASGEVTFTPELNYNGTTTPVNYTVNDDSGATSNIATIIISVSDINDVPVAGDDVATTPEDTPVTISVIANDSDVDGVIDASSVDLNPSLAGIQTTKLRSPEKVFILLMLQVRLPLRRN
ncbi:MAG: cadherin-like domain-containing protein [Sphingobacterium sp.]|nr:cadherin-like domain-containing protein [Sphingobacterium sp.]